MRSAFGVLLVVAAVFAIANSQCERVVKNVSNSDELKAALKNAAPGWTINLAKGTYDDISYDNDVVISGEAGCPIIITSEHIGEAVIRNPRIIFVGSYLVIANLTIEKYDSPLENFDFWGRNGSWSENVTVENMRFASSPPLTFSGVKWATVRNCSFENTYIKASDDTVESVFEKCFFFRDEVDIETGIHFAWGASIFGSSKYNVIRDNMFYGKANTKWSWITLQCFDCHHNEIYRNMFVNSDNTTMESGIRLGFNGVYDNIVRDNFMVINTVEGDYAITVGRYQDNIVCGSNKVAGNTVFTDSKVIDWSC